MANLGGIRRPCACARPSNKNVISAAFEPVQPVTGSDGPPGY